MIDLKNIQFDQKKILRISIVMAIVLYFDYAFIIKPRLDALKNSKTQIGKLTADINSLEKAIVGMRKSPEVMDKSNKSKRFVTEEEIPSLVQFISSCADKNEVKIMQMNPLKDKADTLKNINNTPLRIILNLSGDYHHFGKFLNLLDDSDILLLVQEMKITPLEKDNFRQNINFTLLTYVKK